MIAKTHVQLHLAIFNLLFKLASVGLAYTELHTVLKHDAVSLLAHTASAVTNFLNIFSMVIILSRFSV